MMVLLLSIEYIEGEGISSEAFFGGFLDRPVGETEDRVPPVK